MPTTPDIGTITPPSGFPVDINAIISTAVQLLFAAAGLVFFAVLIIGGFRYLTAGGDEKATAEARKTLTNGFIGLIVVVAAFLIAQLLFSLFGLSSLVNVTGGGDETQMEETTPTTPGTTNPSGGISL